MMRAGSLGFRVAVLTVALLASDRAWAQGAGLAPADAWPTYRDAQGQPLPGATAFQRGPGFYLSTLKILLSWGLFALWVKTTDWVGQDTLRTKLNYSLWNTLVYATFVGSFLSLWVLPWFALVYPLMILAWLIPLIVYIIVRNRAVQAHERVLTRDHLRYAAASAGQKIGLKIAAEKQADYLKGAPVHFKATAGCGRDGEGNLILARRSLGYVKTKGLIAELVDRGGDSMLMEISAQNVAVRYQIDGVWHNLDPLEREPGDMVFFALKTIGGVDAAQRVKRQDGTFAIEYKETNYFCKLISQGVESGERVLVQVQPTKTPVRTLEELGMRPKMQEQLKDLLNRTQGFVLLASTPGGGLSSLFDAALKACDRYMRDFVAVEELNRREHEIENVHVHTYNPASGETPLAVLQKVIRTYPNVLVVRDLVDAATTSFLCEQVGEERLSVGGIRARDASESLLRVLMLKVPPKDFVNVITAVACVRLIRKLCDQCKEAYEPQPELLQQMGLPPGKVQALFRPPSQADPKKPCPKCQGIGYKGRTGLFEMLVVDDGVREVLMKSPKPDLVRASVRKAGMKTFQEEGLILVVKGITSLSELQRVSKT